MRRERVLLDADSVCEEGEPLAHQLGWEQPLRTLPHLARRLSDVGQLQRHRAARRVPFRLGGGGGGCGSLFGARALHGQLNGILCAGGRAQLPLSGDPVGRVGLPALLVLPLAQLPVVAHHGSLLLRRPQPLRDGPLLGALPAQLGEQRLLPALLLQRRLGLRLLEHHLAPAHLALLARQRLLLLARPQPIHERVHLAAHRRCARHRVSQRRQMRIRVETHPANVGGREVGLAVGAGPQPLQRDLELVDPARLVRGRARRLERGRPGLPVTARQLEPEGLLLALLLPEHILALLAVALGLPVVHQSAALAHLGQLQLPPLLRHRRLLRRLLAADLLDPGGALYHPRVVVREHQRLSELLRVLRRLLEHGLKMGRLHRLGRRPARGTHARTAQLRRRVGRAARRARERWHRARRARRIDRELELVDEIECDARPLRYHCVGQPRIEPHPQVDQGRLEPPEVVHLGRDRLLVGEALELGQDPVPMK
mmetsp:Transcript_19188/g.60367  ORF Transcript_19188/g.60367 Transcript_19188/m.60367 type:complete len:484 (-) Transcript_19188:117-1568(-)